mmetsp:Transcript_15376/g.17405  ORF Transcript_15376/g.17405 Transcript_15376/m.17405 type:complete len:259 (+) Transcript_15376:113-889(+)
MISSRRVNYRQVNNTDAEEETEPLAELELGTIKKGGQEGTQNGSEKDSSSKDSVWIRSKEQACLTKVTPFVQVEGNYYLLYGKSRGRGRSWPGHCIVGPDWCCSMFTSALIIIISSWWFSYIFVKLNAFFVFFGFITFMMLLLSYSMTAYTDPGIVKRQTEEELQSQPKGEGTLCRYCNIYRDYGTRHCYDCNACIYEHDHHCPWTGKCIGGNNIRYFNFFIASLFIHLFYVIFTSIQASTDGQSHHRMHAHHIHRGH